MLPIANVKRKQYVQPRLTQKSKQWLTMNLSERLKRRLSVTGKTQAGLARHVGVKPPSVSKWMNGETKQLEGTNLIRAAEYLECEPLWLGQGTGAESVKPPAESNLSIGRLGTKSWEDGDPLDEDTVEVVDLALPVSAGPGAPAWEPVKDGSMKRYKSSWIKRRNLKPEKLGTHIVRGNSMEPGIPDGAILTINTAIERIKHGKVHVIFFQDEFFVKRIFKESDGSLRIASDNPDKSRHPDWIITPDNADSLKVMGVPVDMNFEMDDY